MSGAKIICATCGHPIPPDSRRRRYCSDRCERRRPNRTGTAPRDLRLLTAARQAVQAEVRRTEPNCWICGHPIDLTLDRQRHPLASAVDEITPRSHGGDPTDRTNCHHAHRWCNGARGNRPVTPALQARCQAKYADLTKPTRRW